MASAPPGNGGDVSGDLDGGGEFAGDLVAMLSGSRGLGETSLIVRNGFSLGLGRGKDEAKKSEAPGIRRLGDNRTPSTKKIFLVPPLLYVRVTGPLSRRFALMHIPGC